MHPSIDGIARAIFSQTLGSFTGGQGQVVHAKLGFDLGAAAAKGIVRGHGAGLDM